MARFKFVEYHPGPINRFNLYQFLLSSY